MSQETPKSAKIGRYMILGTVILFFFVMVLVSDCVVRFSSAIYAVMFGSSFWDTEYGDLLPGSGWIIGTALLLLLAGVYAVHKEKHLLFHCVCCFTFLLSCFGLIYILHWSVNDLAFHIRRFNQRWSIKFAGMEQREGEERVHAPNSLGLIDQMWRQYARESGISEATLRAYDHPGPNGVCDCDSSKKERSSESQSSPDETPAKP